MMFTEGVKLDVPQQDNFVVGLVKNRFEVAGRVFAETSHEFGVGTGNPIGRLEQAFTVRVLAYGNQDLAYGRFDPAEVYLGRCRGRGVAGVVGTAQEAVDVLLSI